MGGRRISICATRGVHRCPTDREPRLNRIACMDSQMTHWESARIGPLETDMGRSHYPYRKTTESTLGRRIGRETCSGARD